MTVPKCPDPVRAEIYGHFGTSSEVSLYVEQADYQRSAALK